MAQRIVFHCPGVTHMHHARVVTDRDRIRKAGPCNGHERMRNKAAANKAICDLDGKLVGSTHFLISKAGK